MIKLPSFKKSIEKLTCKEAAKMVIPYIEEQLCEKLGTKVKVKNNKIEIKFNNTNDLNRILELLNFSIE